MNSKVFQPFWHSLSAVYLLDPPCFPSRRLLKSLLMEKGSLKLRYVGDRMNLNISNKDAVEVSRPADRAIESGSVVLAWMDGTGPDFFRVHRKNGSEFQLVADADPDIRHTVSEETILAIANLPRRNRWLRGSLRRYWIDLYEAWNEVAEPSTDVASTVLDKYEQQASAYARSSAVDIDPALAGRIRSVMPEGGNVLVVGSGAGRESFALARQGFCVTGLDFAPAMIRESRAAAERHGLKVRFLPGDVRDQMLPENEFDTILFTYDVYSFIPDRSARTDVLGRLQATLRSTGTIFLSARIVRGLYHRMLLTIQHQRRRGTGAEWGDSHTRWIDSDGKLRRSYVHLFRLKHLKKEANLAGYNLRDWQGGHGILRLK